MTLKSDLEEDMLFQRYMVLNKDGFFDIYVFLEASDDIALLKDSLKNANEQDFVEGVFYQSLLGKTSKLDDL